MEQFLAQHALDSSYLDFAAQWFDPLAAEVADKANSKSCYFLGILGSQGSGKSTLADYLATVLREQKNLRCAHLSIDDYYLPLTTRQQRAKERHPLFSERGVPGTHDIDRLINDVHLLRNTQSGTMHTPAFSKKHDAQLPQSEWHEFTAPLDVLILEGWFVGVSAQQAEELPRAINTLEREEDPDARWRTEVNDLLATQYQTVFQQLDGIAFLKAPSFDCVFNWRREQEQKLMARHGPGGAGQMNDEQLLRFLQYFQRLTEHSMRSPLPCASRTFSLNADRKITECNGNL